MICGRPLDCGRHSCQKKCCPGDCGPCPLNGVQHCPCGKRKFEMTCAQSAPTCDQRCNRSLPCGHLCPDRCHIGPCAKCPLKQQRQCRCGRQSILVECTNLEARCQSRCPLPRSCGRHVCRKRCCPGSSRNGDSGCPPCNEICGETLSCARHRCTAPCGHRGACLPCTFSQSIECSCGNVRIQFRCGEPQPSSGTNLKCSRSCQLGDLTCCHLAPPHPCHRVELEPCPPCKDRPCLLPLASPSESAQLPSHLAPSFALLPLNRPLCGHLCQSTTCCQTSLDSMQFDSLAGRCKPCTASVSLPCHGMHRLFPSACTSLFSLCLNNSTLELEICGRGSEFLPLLRSLGINSPSVQNAYESWCALFALIKRRLPNDHMTHRRTVAFESERRRHQMRVVETLSSTSAHTPHIPPISLPDTLTELTLSDSLAHDLSLMSHPVLPLLVSLSSLKSCENPCHQELECGTHRCSATCHSIFSLEQLQQHVNGWLNSSRGSMTPQAELELWNNFLLHLTSESTSSALCTPCRKPCSRTRASNPTTSYACSHPCKRSCHSDSCHPCDQSVSCRCWCQRSTISLNCSDWLALSPEAIAERRCCLQVCGRKMQCGHSCPLPCHPLHSNSSPLPYAPMLVSQTMCTPSGGCQEVVTRRCQCGKRSQQHPCSNSPQNLPCDPSICSSSVVSSSSSVSIRKSQPDKTAQPSKSVASETAQDQKPVKASVSVASKPSMTSQPAGGMDAKQLAKLQRTIIWTTVAVVMISLYLLVL